MKKIAKTGFIYIHGVTPDLKTSNPGYSKDFHTAILKALKKQGANVSSVKRFEVNWANITLPFKKNLAKFQFDRNPKRGFKRRKGLPVVRVILSAFIYPAVLDILYYVKNKGSAAAPGNMLILEKLHNGVTKAEKSGCKKVVIVAHSLGSVAAYDYVFRFRKQFAFPKKMELLALVTFGSPIPLFASSMGYPMSRKVPIPSYAKKWINLWDYDDGVAGRCEPHFPKRFTKNFLRDIEVNTAWVNPLAAHQNYWKDKEVIKAIAKALENEL